MSIIGKEEALVRISRSLEDKEAVLCKAKQDYELVAQRRREIQERDPEEQMYYSLYRFMPPVQAEKIPGPVYVQVTPQRGYARKVTVEIGSLPTYRVGREIRTLSGWNKPVTGIYRLQDGGIVVEWDDYTNRYEEWAD